MSDRVLIYRLYKELYKILHIKKTNNPSFKKWDMKVNNQFSKDEM